MTCRDMGEAGVGGEVAPVDEGGAVADSSKILAVVLTPTAGIEVRTGARGVRIECPFTSSTTWLRGRNMSRELWAGRGRPVSPVQERVCGWCLQSLCLARDTFDTRQPTRTLIPSSAHSWTIL